MMQAANIYAQSDKLRELSGLIRSENARVNINSLAGSSYAFIVAAASSLNKDLNHLIILPDKQQAAYFANDLETLYGERDLDYTQKKVLFFPSSAKTPYSSDTLQNANTVLRLETLNRINNKEKLIVVTYPQAICEKVAAKRQIETRSTKICKSDRLIVDDLIEVLDKYAFERVDFVTRSGEYAIRGGIIDVFSFSMQKPCRIEMQGENVGSLRVFDVVSQMSLYPVDSFVIVPDLQNQAVKENTGLESFFSYLGKDTVVWTKDLSLITENAAQFYALAQANYAKKDSIVKPAEVDALYLYSDLLKQQLSAFRTVEVGLTYTSGGYTKTEYSVSEQPAFNKNFDLFAGTLSELTAEGYTNYFFVKDDKQKQRIEHIIEEYAKKDYIIKVEYILCNISGGFIDHELKHSCFTDHQLFERYHRYFLQDSSSDNERLTIEDLVTLKPGDYVTHIDYGVGRFAGLEKIDNNGRQQEAIRLVYKNDDMLYVSIHSLHKISRYAGKDGVEPKLNRLGSNAWQQLKQKTKKRVKDIARDLIALYAQRKAAKGFQFSADTYLQNELEASFMYEDTPDQYKASAAVKRDMEKPYPMDRLVCGDVGFGKTEIAIRAAFKAVCDSKQVAVLVPTTILAFQHYQTFTERLKDMPCRVDYINRFRTAKDKTKILKDLKEGKIDILIGTHKLVGKDVNFKDLGLLVIDEEQKFGVSIKEKIKQMKVNIDTLTLTATPIPRTLQFSLMGARDLSVINTPPANRQPVTTQVSVFDKALIRDAVLHELSRGGQVYFVNNRVQNIYQIASLLQSLVPDARICVGHGQMDGTELENIMMDFINGQFDVLVSTTIIENGLDISNANTIIINDAQNYGLSDLHQLRGRVGRTNKKAFCYLLVPGENLLTDQAYKRLQAIEEFSSIGSGFVIAMRDLDIRGAGNILGAEQSGFISEIGYDMYNKILNEAIQELKDDEFKDLYSQEGVTPQESAVSRKECVIETDLEVLIPDYYITNITQRLKIYKELDCATKEEDLANLQNELTDRFGEIPQQTKDLFEIVRIRGTASLMNIEKMILKRGKMVLNFNSDKIDFTDGGNFTHVLLFVNQYPQKCQLKENGEVLQLIVSDVKTVQQAGKILNYLNGIK
ncbi:MAG: transcription-repair coupling factor [Bacteroidales bacterium]|nr:transcription-repair coupling factor [Bacteroidales bacterium]